MCIRDSDNYAYKGFKYEAIDYVLKPYSPKAILSAVDRVKKYDVDDVVFRKLSALAMPVARLSNTRISLSTEEGLHLVEYDDIVRLIAQRAYCEIILKQDQRIIVSKSMGELEKQLPQSKFFRVHSGHMVHTKYVKQVCNKDGGYLVMCDGSQVPVARRRRQDFLAAIQV